MAIGRIRAADGTELAYEVRGSGPPVYICHGGPATDYDYLVADLAGLEDDCRLVFHHYRGSGDSDRASQDSYTHEQLADDLDRLRAGLGDDRIVVLGHSMGGFVAIQFALRHPATAAGLVLVGASPGVPITHVLAAMSTPARARMAVRAIRYGVGWAWRKETPARRTARYRIWKATFEARPSVQHQLDARSHLIDNDNVARLERQSMRTRLAGPMATLACPILVITGPRDADAVSGARAIRRTVRNVRFVTVDAAGHHPLFEAPDVTLSEIRAFVHSLQEEDPRCESPS